MKSRDFCYWLQGFLELAPEADTREGIKGWQVETLRKHLNMVFRHEIDPSFGADKPALDKIHRTPTGERLDMKGILECGPGKTELNC